MDEGISERSGGDFWKPIRESCALKPNKPSESIPGRLTGAKNLNQLDLTDTSEESRPERAGPGEVKGLPRPGFEVDSKERRETAEAGTREASALSWPRTWTMKVRA